MNCIINDLELYTDAFKISLQIFIHFLQYGGRNINRMRIKVRNISLLHRRQGISIDRINIFQFYEVQYFLQWSSFGV